MQGGSSPDINNEWIDKAANSSLSVGAHGHAPCTRDPRQRLLPALARSEGEGAKGVVATGFQPAV
jgi:hypothetical protein